MTIENKCILARTTKSEEIMWELSLSDDYYIKCHLTENPNILKKILIKLSNDSNDSVRYHVANISNCSKILIKLSKDENRLIRRIVSKNINTPHKALTNLINDECELIRENVVNHKNFRLKAFI